MNAIKKARRLIENDPFGQAGTTLAHLVRALESDESFGLGVLYALDLNNFELAIEILREWRIDRYYAGKAKLHDLAFYRAHLGEKATD